MNKNIKGAMVVVGVAAIAYGTYTLVSKSKQALAKAIAKRGGHHSFSDLMMLEYDFIKAWAKAIVKGKEKFSYEGHDYWTKGGSWVPGS